MKGRRILSAILAVIMVLTSIVASPSALTPVSAATFDGLKENTNYVIVSKKSGKAMTVAGYATNNSASINQQTVKYYPAQIWTLKDAGGGYCQIVNKHSNKSLNIPNNSTDEGTQIIQWDQATGDNSLWKLEKVSNGYYSIKSKLNSGFGLNVEGGKTTDKASIIQWSYKGSDNELWEFREVSDSQITSNPEPEKAQPKEAFDAYVKKFVEDKGDYSQITHIWGFWAEAEITEMFIDAYERFQDEETKKLMIELVDGWIVEHKKDWKKNDYNDDIMWAVIMCTRTYLHTNDKQYLDIAKSNFDMCYERAWTDKLGGGLVWKQGNKTKNACVNGPGAIASCYLAKATGDNGYYEKAKAMIKWMDEKLVQSDGSVWDSINWENNGINKWVSTYNQGTYIGACTMLYEHYKDQSYLNKAKKAADRAVKLGSGDDRILNGEQNNADLIGFKSVLSRWIRYYALSTKDTDYNTWMQKNADTAWNNRNSDNIMWTEFGKQTIENLENSNEPVEGGSISDGKHKISGYASWGSCAPLAWLINCSDMEARQNGENPDEPGSTTEDASKKWELKSPNGKTILTMQSSKSGALSYSVTQDGKTMVESSDLGIKTNKGDFTTGLTFKEEKDTAIDETYKMLSGKASTYTNKANEKKVTFTKNNVQFDVVLRAYDDGVAFRYIITAESGTELKFSTNAERTSFKLPSGAKVWQMPNSNDFMFEKEYETTTINNFSGKNASMPMLYNTNGKYGLIVEADKHGTYVGSVLKPEGNRVLRTNFDPQQSGDVTTKAPFTSPWRAVVIGSEETILKNTMVENLSPAPDPQYDFENWVDPGVSSWSWVSYYGGQEDPEIHKKFIDLAADMGWKYYILDEGWQPKSKTSGSNYEGMSSWWPEIKQYALDRGVKLIAWVHKNDMDTAAERTARFKEWSEEGIVGIKVDFFYNERQAMLQLHDDIYKDAAKYKMMVNVHGSNPPSGEIRTYPNVIAREAIRGQEQGGIKAEQYTLIPFIRSAVGTADVTEQLFSRDTGKTTMGFQIALSVLIENGIRSLGSTPEAYYSIPEAVSYYTNFPSKWDDLKLIQAVVGDYVNIARQTGTSWYTAGISNNAREFSFKPEFLEEGKNYKALIYKENGRQNLKMETVENVTTATTIKVSVEKGGGYAAKFIPQEGAIKQLNITPGKVQVQKSRTKNITLKYNPSDTVATDVKWTVTDPSIVSVKTNGKKITLTGLKEGKTSIVAASVFNGSKNAVIEVEVTPDPYPISSSWQVLNNSGNSVITGENSVEIAAQTGVIDKDVYAMKAPDGDFEIEAKLSGGFSADYQGGFIGVFDKNNVNNFVGVGRRYHGSFNTGSSNKNNHIAMMANGNEFYSHDSKKDNDVYVKLVKNGSKYTGYYRYSTGDSWKQVTKEAGNAGPTLEKNINNRYIGFFTGSGGTQNSLKVTISEFKLNGNAVKVASKNSGAAGFADAEYTYHGIEAEDGTLSEGVEIKEGAEYSEGKYITGLSGEKKASYAVKFAKDGSRDLNLYYNSDSSRTMTVTVNGTAYKVNCSKTSGSIPGAVPAKTEVKVKAGENTIEISDAENVKVDRLEIVMEEADVKANTKAYNIEAENCTTKGKVEIRENSKNSNGKYVGNLDGNLRTSLSYTVISNSTEKRNISLYTNAEMERKLAVYVNGTLAGIASCKSNGSWEEPTATPAELGIGLVRGENTITIRGYGMEAAPNLDRFEVALTEQETAATVELHKNNEGGNEGGTAETVKEAFAKAVQEAEKLQEADYTAESWAAFATELKAAQEVTEDTTDEELSALLAALVKAQNALVRIGQPITGDADLEAAQAKLAQVLADAAKVAEAGQTDYTDESWTEFITAYDKAKNAGEDAVVEELDALREELTTAQQNLKHKTPTSGGNSNTPNEGEGSGENAGGSSNTPNEGEGSGGNAGGGSDITNPGEGSGGNAGGSSNTPNSGEGSIGGTGTNNTTIPVTDEERQIAEAFGVSAEVAKEISKTAKEHKISEDTLYITEEYVESAKGEKDLDGASFAALRAKSTKQTKNSIKVSWTKVKGADGYLVYGNKCSKNSSYKLLKDTKSLSYTQKKLKKGTSYKYLVIAYKQVRGTRITLAASKSIHVVTQGGKTGTTTSVIVKPTKVSIKAGKSKKLTAREERTGKKAKAHRNLSYESDKPSVASVNSKGKITAKKKGTCTIYVYAQNGVYKKVKVTVK